MLPCTDPERIAAAPSLPAPLEHRIFAKPMTLAYLTTQYPKVSHTFIRREIRELETRGHRILRVAIRSPADAVVDPLDVEEAGNTLVVLAQPTLALLRAVCTTALTEPRSFARSFATVLRLALRGDRGLVAHMAYLVEAAYLRRHFEAAKVSHVHVHFGTNAATVALLLKQLGGPPYSLTIHGPDEFDAVRGLALAAKVEESSFTVAVSDYTAAQLMRWVDLPAWKRIHVVRCAVDERFLAAVDPIREDFNTLVCVGRLTPQKGQLLLLEAVGGLVREGLDLRLVLVGDGELRPAIEERIAALGLRQHVSITGWVGEAEVRQAVHSARCLVLPSFAEGLPVVLMEALALGRPVISTFVAGIPELVEPGRSGWLVPAGSVAELGSALREALQTPVQRLNEMGLAGRERVLRNHRLCSEVDRLAAQLEAAGVTRGA